MLSLAELECAENNRDAADRWSEEGMRRAKEIGADQLTLEASWTRGRVLARLGSVNEARRLLGESVMKAESMDHRLFLWQILHDIVMLERSVREPGAEEVALTKVRRLLNDILGEFKTPNLIATFCGMKEVRDLLGDAG